MQTILIGYPDNINIDLSSSSDKFSLANRTSPAFPMSTCHTFGHGVLECQGAPELRAVSISPQVGMVVARGRSCVKLGWQSSVGDC